MSPGAERRGQIESDSAASIDGLAAGSVISTEVSWVGVWLFADASWRELPDGRASTGGARPCGGLTRTWHAAMD